MYVCMCVCAYHMYRCIVCKYNFSITYLLCIVCTQSVNTMVNCTSPLTPSTQQMDVTLGWFTVPKVLIVLHLHLHELLSFTSLCTTTGLVVCTRRACRPSTYNHSSNLFTCGEIVCILHAQCILHTQSFLHMFCT